MVVHHAQAQVLVKRAADRKSVYAAFRRVLVALYAV